MTTALRESARTVATDGKQSASRIAKQMFADLMALEPEIRRGFFKAETAAAQEQILRIAMMEAGTPLGLYVDDPVGFIEDVLDETMWSKSREVVSSVPNHTITAVPSCFGSSKTWGAARVDLWWTMVHAPGTALAVTIAPLWRQVVRQMWPEIRRAHARADLPGKVDTYQMKQMATEDGRPLAVVTSYGLVANKHDESAVQGIHSPNLLLVVDEAGGIARTVGQNLRAVLTGDARALYIGNPPTDDEGGWFESVCNESDAEDDVNVITISAHSTPAMTGEQAPRCKSCPAGIPAHTMAKHLVTAKWVKDTLREFGEDSPYVQAKVHARFPRGGASRALPYSWVELARDVLDPEDDDDYLALADYGVPDEPDPMAKVRRGAWIRLGVDVAADGGDELVVARAAGDLVTIRHTSSGSSNADPNTVAGKVLVEIKRAQNLARAIDSPYPVRVKVDGIGVGWGVAGILEAWGREGLHDAEIVKVIVSEGTEREPEPTATFRPRIKRDEMWLAMRELLPKPTDADEGVLPKLRLRVDRKTIAQLTAPEITTSSAGQTIVESKDSLRKRGMSSPDRAEAVLLAVYEPAPKKPKRKKAGIISV